MRFSESPNLPKVFVNYISKGNIVTLRKASRQQLNQMIKVNITSNETYGHYKPLDTMQRELSVISLPKMDNLMQILRRH